jgi:hypothetical protein
MSTEHIQTALNELKSTVTQQVRNIKKDVSSLDIYISNYDALLELPLVQQLMEENKKLKKKNRKLEKQLLAALLDNRGQVEKKQRKMAFVKSEPVEEDDFEIECVEPSKSENIVYELIEQPSIDVETEALLKFKESTDELLDIVEKTVISTEKSVIVSQQILADIKALDDEEEEVEEVEEVVEEEVEEVEEEEVVEEEVVEEEVEEVEEVVEEEVEEVVEEEVEEVVEEEVEEVEEEEVEEVEEVVEEEVEEVVEEDDSGEVYEITIKGKSYYVMNEKDSIIYDVDENGDVSVEVGVYKNGKPVFNKK